MDNTKKYVVLRHLCMPHKGLCFFSNNTDNDPEYSFKGERWYEIVGYADEISEAQELVRNNYGGLPTNKEFEEYWKSEIAER